MKKRTKAEQHQENLREIESFKQMLRESGLTDSEVQDYMDTVDRICIEHINDYLRRKSVRSG